MHVKTLTESTAVLIFVLHCFNHHPALSHSEPVPEEGVGGGGSGHRERKAENKVRGESFLQQISVHRTGQDRTGHNAAV